MTENGRFSGGGTVGAGTLGYSFGYEGRPKAMRGREKPHRAAARQCAARERSRDEKGHAEFSPRYSAAAGRILDEALSAERGLELAEPIPPGVLISSSGLSERRDCPSKYAPCSMARLW
jgi:hypothetical protein